MESTNERHLSTDQLLRLIDTVRYLVSNGQKIEKVKEDLRSSHGLTENDFIKLFSLMGS